jgi:LPS-assembly protein
VQWHFTDYELDPDFHAGVARATRSLPITSLDAGLVFERQTSLFGAPATQTFEPRLFYAYVPFRDQSNLPNFDSADADINFAQLFTENTFTGSDRIAEANQVTTAVVSRFLDEASGAERLRVALGQRYYFGSERVALPGEVPRTNLTSDVLFDASATLGRKWATELALDYSTLAAQFAKATFAVRWQPRAASVINFSYRYQTGVLEQLGISTQWPISRRLYGVLGLNYSIFDRGWIETLGGLEYKAPCWVGRFIVQRYSVDVHNYTTAWFLQIELNGLTSVGTSPLDQLQRSIPGFQRINPALPPPAAYESYE